MPSIAWTCTEASTALGNTGSGWGPAGSAPTFGMPCAPLLPELWLGQLLRPSESRGWSSARGAVWGHCNSQNLQGLVGLGQALRCFCPLPEAAWIEAPRP